MSLISCPLIVSYSVDLRPGMEDCYPEFTAPDSFTGKKRDDRIAEERLKFVENAPFMPYFGSLKEVAIMDIHANALWRTTPGQPAALQVQEWITKKPGYSSAWSYNPLESSIHRPPRYYFVGFSPRTFLKMLGLECAYRGVKPSLPPGLWFGNSEHRDIQNAAIPTEDAKSISFDTVLKTFDLEKYVPFTPHQDLDSDLKVITELAIRLGFFELERQSNNPPQD